MKQLVLVELVAGGEGGGAVDAWEGAAGVLGVHVLLERLEAGESLAAEGALDEAVFLWTGAVLGNGHCKERRGY